MLLSFAYGDALVARIRMLDTPRIRGALLALGLLFAAVVFVRWHHLHYAHPTAASLQSGWWGWTDQGRYYRAARAWAHLDLRASEHWYLPGYPLLGALFYWVMPVEPFLLPNLLCLLLTGMLTVWLAEVLARDRAFAWAYGMLAFQLSCILWFTARKSWIEPWTSTPLAPLVLGLLLAAIRFAQAPRVGRGFLAGLLCGGIVMVRPTEAMAAGPPAALFCLWALLREPIAMRGRIAIAGAAIAGAALPLAATGLIHLAIFSLAPGEYLKESLGTGFELRLLPLRWITLVVAPEPLHEAALGIGVMFPWVLPGFAGLIAALLVDRPRRPIHLLIATAVALHWVFYLCYRDLHPEGLWHFGNYHYFKWTEPVLGLYAVLLLPMLLQPRRLWAVVAGIAVVALACSWRAELTPLQAGQQDARLEGAHRILLPSGLASVRDLVTVAGRGDFDDIYFGPHQLAVGARHYAYNGDFKAYPLPGGMAITALRPLLPGAVRIEATASAPLDPALPPILARQHLVFGIPCALAPLSAVCQPPRLDAAPVLPLGVDVTPGGSGDAYFRDGWIGTGPAERCTLGPLAELRFAAPRTGPLQLVVSATGFPTARASAPTRISVWSDETRIADWSVPPVRSVALTAEIPDGAWRARDLRLQIANPRKLKDFGDRTGNQALGICVQRFRLSAVP